MPVTGLTERLRAALGGKAFRVYEYTHGAAGTITAGSMDLDYIDCIAGTQHNASITTTASDALEGQWLSIAADRGAIITASGGVGTTVITVIGW